ncbi:penicillin-binding protein [Halalkalibacterium halodurans]|uniref:BH2885 protein n=1 Tax=Halalkalibacterium halodurans (strain ATCC BAA-125 / DSM 18197 / FERM 7344 / JCM 9153 / C-125) TaxID=272558 RepID=Q9K8W7_HALH5|nr:hypothetical protein [Halalkalibacterium halodurans]MDY7223438.1 penicillin-binding protein [Halalkalibacterium halodurans]MDY7242659.1 penicillin-binding protein [Halalkalibacterium halodurans]MED4081634.1 penicillin-binding protein [Halalkalibacterium halodurans]MED4084954.1 penicillin-binding protein [Halalkalibacterium halodurans]MED4104159.1 penicillin-binding protein [Halalkalibacterium halodurans]
MNVYTHGPYYRQYGYIGTGERFYPAVLPFLAGLAVGPLLFGGKPYGGYGPAYGPSYGPNFGPNYGPNFGPMYGPPSQPPFGYYK